MGLQVQLRNFFTRFFRCLIKRVSTDIHSPLFTSTQKRHKKEWLLHFAELFYGLSTRLRPENLNDVERERRANQLESLIVSSKLTVGYKLIKSAIKCTNHEFLNFIPTHPTLIMKLKTGFLQFLRIYSALWVPSKYELEEPYHYLASLYFPKRDNELQNNNKASFIQAKP